ncbi:MAG: flagellin, partial [SAR324 cluster bacterium]|nr:flagellin [SAR324 cluster bacterium]
TVEVPVLDENGNQVGVEKFRQHPDELIGSADNPKIEGYLHLSQQSVYFQLGDRRDGHEKFSFADVRATSLGKGVENVSRFESLADLTDVTGAQDAAELIDTAIDEIANLRADLGAFQKHTLERTKTGTQISSDHNLAAEAILRDTDMAAEMAEMTKHQILLQSGQSMLSQANQKPRNVLHLLQAG